MTDSSLPERKLPAEGVMLDGKLEWKEKKRPLEFEEGGTVVLSQKRK